MELVIIIDMTKKMGESLSRYRAMFFGQAFESLQTRLMPSYDGNFSRVRTAPYSTALIITNTEMT